jgi:hypothetical protein
MMRTKDSPGESLTKYEREHVKEFLTVLLTWIYES